MRGSTIGLALAAAFLLANPAPAAEIKIGFIGVFTGMDASSGLEIERGADLYVKHHQVPGGHKLEILKRDTAGPAPDRAKRLAEELVVRDKVVLITGVQYSNEGFAIMDVCRDAKIPVLVMMAAANGMTDACPYSARVSFGTWQASFPLGEYAFQKLGIKTAAMAYANYGPGKDASSAFRAGFEKAGGKLVDEVPFPFPQINDFTPFLQRLKDRKPDGVYLFVPSGKWATGVVKTYNDLGMRESGIKLLATGDLVAENELRNMGDVPVGVTTIYHYSAVGKRPENIEFLRLWKEAYGKDSDPAFYAAQGWDGMAAIYHVIEKTDGKVTPEGFLAAIKGWQYASPRGPLLIDPETRDAVQNQYVRVVERVDGRLANVEIDTIPMVKDPWRIYGKKPQ
jgi:branched-chain amino acid transport system substrate-binding protein